MKGSPQCNEDGADMAEVASQDKEKKDQQQH